MENFLEEQVREVAGGERRRKRERKRNSPQSGEEEEEEEDAIEGGKWGLGGIGVLPEGVIAKILV